MSYIGLDLGTSSLKAILIDDAQRVLAEHTVPLTVARPHPGWSEQEPEQWFDATKAAIKALGAQADISGVKAIGMSGHMHGATLLDSADQVLRPCILWNDTRSAVEAAALDADPRFRALTGNIVFPGFTAPKVAWAKNHEPDVFAKISKVLLPKDFLRLRLTGELARRGKARLVGRFAGRNRIGAQSYAAPCGGVTCVGRGVAGACQCIGPAKGRCGRRRGR